MPVRMEDVTVTQDDVTVSMRSDNLKRIDKFLQSASEDEAKKIRGWSEHRLMALGAIEPKQEPRKRDRLLARVAVEAVPILLTILVYIPAAYIGVLFTMSNTILMAYGQYCPPQCNDKAIFAWVITGAIGMIAVFIAYYATRRVMIKARN